MTIYTVLFYRQNSARVHESKFDYGTFYKKEATAVRISNYMKINQEMKPDENLFRILIMRNGKTFYDTGTICHIDYINDFNYEFGVIEHFPIELYEENIEAFQNEVLVAHQEIKEILEMAIKFMKER